MSTPQTPAAPHGNASSPVAAASAGPAPPRSFSRPTTANAHANTIPAQDATSPAPGAPTTAPTVAPTTAPTPTAAAPQTTTTEEPLSLNDRLNASDRYWKFK